MAGLEENMDTRNLDTRPTCRLGSTKDYISNGVVTRGPLPPQLANLIISVGVCSAMAFWTEVVIIMKKNP